MPPTAAPPAPPRSRTSRGRVARRSAARRRTSKACSAVTSFSNTDPASLEADYEKAQERARRPRQQGTRRDQGRRRDPVDALSRRSSRCSRRSTTTSRSSRKIPTAAAKLQELRHPRAQRRERPRRGLPHAGVRDRHDHRRLSRHSGPLRAAGAPHRSLSRVQTPRSGRLCALRRGAAGTRRTAPAAPRPRQPASRARVRGRGTPDRRGAQVSERAGRARLSSRPRWPPWRPDPVAVVTWVPTTAARSRERGFDQAELLAAGRRGEARAALSAPARPQPGAAADRTQPRRPTRRPDACEPPASSPASTSCSSMTS